MCATPVNNMDEKPTQKEMFFAFAGQDLNGIKRYMENLRGSWNGEDSKFMHEGEIYHEDHVSAAEEIIEKIDQLQELLNEF